SRNPVSPKKPGFLQTSLSLSPATCYPGETGKALSRGVAMRSIISVVTVAGLFLGVGLLGAQPKKKDSDSKPKDLDSKPKESDYKKKKKEQDENFKKDFDKRKMDLTGQLVAGRSLRAWSNDLILPDASIKE